MLQFLLFRVLISVLLSLLPFLVIGQGISTNQGPLPEQLDGALTTADTASLNRMNQLAASYRNNQPDSAILLANRVLTLADSGLLTIRLQAYKTITAAYYMTSDAKLCYDFSEQIIRVAEQLGDKKSMLNGQLYLGLAYLLQDKFEEGIKVFDTYLLLAVELEDSLSIARAYLNRSINHDGMENFEQALSDVNNCLAISREINHHYFEAMALNRKGYILSDLNRYQEAVNDHFAALEVMSDDNDWERCFAYAGLAQAYLGLKDLDQSIVYGQRGIDLAMSMGVKWDIQNVADILYQAYELKGDYRKALSYYKLYKIYNDSIYSESNEKKIHQLQLEQAAQVQAALANENELNKQLVERQSKELILMSSLIGLLLVISGGLYYVIKSKSRLTRKLQAQQQKLEELNEMKDRIFSIVAHDMRSPMHTVWAMLYLIKNKPDHVQMDELLDGVQHRISTVIKSLDSILEWSLRQFQSELTSPPQPIDTEEIIQEQIQLCSYDAEQKKVSITHDPTSSHKVLVEGEHLRIIVRNIIANAIKFTNEQGEITISYQDLGTQLSIDIADNGIGITKEKLTRLFQSRGNSSAGTRSEIGAGLGLFLCKQYAEMNGGTISVDSTPGIGSTFHVILNKA